MAVTSFLLADTGYVNMEAANPVVILADVLGQTAQEQFLADFRGVVDYAESVFVYVSAVTLDTGETETDISGAIGQATITLPSSFGELSLREITLNGAVYHAYVVDNGLAQMALGYFNLVRYEADGVFREIYVIRGAKYQVTYVSEHGDFHGTKAVWDDPEMCHCSPYKPDLLTAKSGYVFAGWYFDAEFTQPATDTSNSAITLYAKWLPPIQVQERRKIDGRYQPIHRTTDSDAVYVGENTLTTALAGKADAESGKGLSANDYTDEEKAKLAGIAAGAQVNPGAATQSATGLMSADDKKKLDGIATGAQVNSLTGVKGNAESSYRTGNVNITPANIGLGNVPNVATNDQTPTYTEASALSALSSGEKLSVVFGKIAKGIADLISHIADTTKHITAAERAAWNGKTSNTGTITEIKMNGASKGTSGSVDLGTVITAHQDLSGLENRLANTEAEIGGTKFGLINARIGDTVHWAGYKWIVVDMNNAYPATSRWGGAIVLMMDEIYSMTVFADSQPDSSYFYENSVLRSVAGAFEDKLANQYLEQCADIYLPEYIDTAKIFVPVESVLREYSYFKDLDHEKLSVRLKGMYNDALTGWWLASQDDYGTLKPKYVTPWGYIATDTYAKSYGFRPFVALSIDAVKNSLSLFEQVDRNTETIAKVTNRVSGGAVGLAATAKSGTVGEIITITDIDAAVSAFTSGDMVDIVSILLKNGAPIIYCTLVKEGDYESAFDLLMAIPDIRYMVCDSQSGSVHYKLSQAINKADEKSQYRIGVVETAHTTVQGLTSYAADLNSEHMVVVSHHIDRKYGYVAAALAGLMTSANSVRNINGAKLLGLAEYSLIPDNLSDEEMGSLVHGGVATLESVNSAVSVVRSVTTRATTADIAADS